MSATMTKTREKALKGMQDILNQFVDDHDKEIQLLKANGSKELKEKTDALVKRLEETTKRPKQELQLVLAQEGRAIQEKADMEKKLQESVKQHEAAKKRFHLFNQSLPS